jgi:GT2 family glycosyltransferase
VVEQGDLVTAIQQGVDEVGADEAGPTGDEHAHRAHRKGRADGARAGLPGRRARAILGRQPAWAPATRRSSPRAHAGTPKRGRLISGVSVIICAYSDERWPLLCETIASVLQQDPPAEEILLVVDHNPALLQRARLAFEEVRVVANDAARGLSGARNTGVAQSRGSILVFLDDDATARPGWLRSLNAAFAEPSVMGAGGVARPAWEGAAPAWFPPEFLWVIGASYQGLPLTAAPIRNPIGANMAFRRDAFERIGGFTEGIGRIDATPLGCEETEFSIRLQAALPEGVVLQVPDAVVDHHVSAARATWRYFVSRCWAEGASKALVTARVGSAGALSSERTYVSRTLPLGVLAGLRDAAHGKRGGLGRAGAIVAGLGITGAGYVAHRVASARRGPARSNLAARATSA